MRTPRSAPLFVVLFLVACGSDETSSGPSDAAGVDLHFPDDTASLDDTSDATRADETSDVDARSACPPSIPAAGSACGDPVLCPYPDAVCGGETSASCVDHRWQVPTPTCGPWCPASQPTSGEACTFPAENVCWYWDAILDAATSCASCHCVGGVWSCDDGVACAFPSSDCAPGKACSDARVGCGTGKCSFYCRCAGDGTFQCSAHPC